MGLLSESDCEVGILLVVRFKGRIVFHASLDGVAVASSLLKGTVRFALLWLGIVVFALSNLVQDDLTPSEGIIPPLALNQQRMHVLCDGELEQQPERCVILHRSLLFFTQAEEPVVSVEKIVGFVRVMDLAVCAMAPRVVLLFSSDDLPALLVRLDQWLDGVPVFKAKRAKIFPTRLRPLEPNLRFVFQEEVYEVLHLTFGWRRLLGGGNHFARVRWDCCCCHPRGGHVCVCACADRRRRSTACTAANHRRGSTRPTADRRRGSTGSVAGVMLITLLRIDDAGVTGIVLL